MAATLKELLTNNQTVTITLSSLTTGSARQGTVIDNTTNLDLDASLTLKYKTGAAGTSATGYVEVRACGSSDGGTSFTESAGASDAAITLTSPPNAPLVGVFNAVANATTYIGGPFSVAAAFGGNLPGKWAPVCVNQAGGTSDTTAGNFVMTFERVQGQSV